MSLPQATMQARMRYLFSEVELTKVSQLWWQPISVRGRLGSGKCFGGARDFEGDYLNTTTYL
jgi:hypothetical protein